VKISPLFK